MNRYSVIFLCFLFAVQAAAASTFIVDDLSSQSDANPGDGVCRSLEDSCTLRGAIMEANALAGADRIEFSVAGTITVPDDFPFPPITEPVEIDGTTAPGYNVQASSLEDAVPTVFIQDNEDYFLSGDTLRVEGTSDVSILAIGISGIRSAGIYIDNVASRVWIDRCYIGLGTDGQMQDDIESVSQRGIQVSGTQNHVGQTTEGGQVIGLGNVVGGLDVGIAISGSDNTISGNYVGMRANGTTAIPNAIGIQVFDSSNTRIGFAMGPTLYGNVVAASTDFDIFIFGGSDNEINGNYIGFLPSSFTVQSTAGFVIRSPRSIIRNNRIASTGGAEFTFGSESTGVLIEDNDFGDRPAVAIPMGGIVNIEANGARIINNQFVGSSVTALRIMGAIGFEVIGNRFGFTENLLGATSLANFSDLRINSSSIGTVSNNRFAFTDGGGAIGLTDSSSISLSSNTYGMASDSNSGTGTALFIGSGVSEVDIDGDAFFNNDNAIVFNASPPVPESVEITSVEMQGNATAIDLIENLALANDPGDSDEGPNRLQNTPVILSINGAQSPYLVEFMVDSASGSSDYPITVEFYGASADATPQGQTLLATGTYAAPGIVSNLSIETGNFDNLVTLAIDASGNTSEFSDKYLLPPPPLIFSDSFEGAALPREN